MENKKSGVLTGVIIGLLIGLVVGLVLYIVMDKKDDNDNKTDDKKQTTETTKDDKKKEDKKEEPKDDDKKEENSYEYTSFGMLPDGSKATGIVDIDTSKYTNIYDYIEEQENVKVIIDYYEKVGDDYPEKQYELSSAEKEKFINNMKKSHFEIKLGGLGGMLTSSIFIKYTRNGEEKTVKIYQSYALSSSDDINIFKIIDDNATVKEDNANVYAIYDFDNTIYDLVPNVN